MFRSFKATGGYAAKLPGLKDRTFEFKEGVNILYGPNGCGKSTILRILGAYSGCQKEGGWSRATGQDKTKYNEASKYPEAFEELLPGMDLKATAEVDWDGSPTFLTSASESDGPVTAFGLPSDGLLGEMDRLFMHRDQSSGQNRLVRIDRLVTVLKTPPEPVKGDLAVESMADGQTREYNTEHFKTYRAYVKSLKPTGRVTLLADELDRSLDLVLQAIFCTRVIPRFAEGRQVIMASHNPFVFSIPGANIIDMAERSGFHGKYLLEVATNPVELAKRAGGALLDRLESEKERQGIATVAKPTKAKKEK